MRRVLVSAALFAIQKAPPIRRCAPSVTAAATISPLVAMEQRRLASHTALADVTRRELDDEQQRSGKPEKPEVPAGWKLERKPGEMLFTMSKTYEDEEILIRFLGNDTESEDDIAFEFLTFVTSKGKSLMCNMAFQDGGVVMRTISFIKDAKLALDESPEASRKRQRLYEGPQLDDLDVDLIDALTSYFNERGLTEELCKFMDEYGIWAEQAEYEDWLSEINRFVS
ncbi:p22 protein precursor [Trypanosoma rangeli]|uniref:p22 protein n=1 Tax=Trypanosoma rangeli TaxID=5698 RepID=A0A422P4Z7_TRYRA|nr:p22 protein precursor [Trypanosoma rangeli]RNF12755.1 p22 protein precursor [Trypanosoma rangeli]|eukprot:RNF12755.1 p22 protein precursor [Trypanosoma rangeli]